MKRILLCTDGSDYAMAATEYALWLAHQRHGDVRALHVTDPRLFEIPLLADLSGSIGAQPYQALLPQIRRLHEEKARVILETVSALAAKRGVPCTTVHKTGGLTDAVLAEEQAADLVVLGQRGEHARQTGEMIGSSVERIVRRSIKPCLVTPARFAPIHSLLAACDGSAHSDKALEVAIRWAVEMKRPLTLLTVAGEDPARSAAVLEAARATAAACGLAAGAELLHGHADAEILRFAESQKVDLIVMGAYGHTRIREFILGSTTSQVIRKARVPVLLVR